MVSSLPLRTTMFRVLSFLMTSLTSLAETTDCPLMLIMTSFSLSPPLQHRGKRNCNASSWPACRGQLYVDTGTARNRKAQSQRGVVTANLPDDSFDHYWITGFPFEIFRPNCQSCPLQKCLLALCDR